MDRTHQKTDNRIDSLEREIEQVYKTAEKAIFRLFEPYFKKCGEKLLPYQKQLENGEIDEKKYKSIIIKNVLSTKEWRKLRDKASKIYTETAQQAMELTNKARLDVYVMNYNEIGKDIERQARRLIDGQEED